MAITANIMAAVWWIVWDAFYVAATNLKLVMTIWNKSLCPLFESKTRFVVVGVCPQEFAHTFSSNSSVYPCQTPLSHYQLYKNALIMPKNMCHECKTLCSFIVTLGVYRCIHRCASLIHVIFGSENDLLLMAIKISQRAGYMGIYLDIEYHIRLVLS